MSHPEFWGGSCLFNMIYIKERTSFILVVLNHKTKGGSNVYTTAKE